ncbi:MAG: capsule assembly Wzi family protein [Candidatus Marinimicrobia bacterium]|nr:capsule assembly Wzi family protein [Candidatus Neomarinimicrobiota bacterium]MCF7850180.1 capsule assembly Wzi family protein [Candidatus Neomarinimicrobiota bacterium]MCF7905206.1 capsule assembly Wzi family protein [Candidatus Neomarinimicrobiota bacterium]
MTALGQFYYNDNVPNLENSAELWVGKGTTLFSSIRMSFEHKNFYLAVEPYYQYASNRPFTSYHVHHIPSKAGEVNQKFNVLNDGPGKGEGALRELRLRQTQLYIHWKGLGGGYSNASMWWGPGIHTTLNMTNNTSGFPHLVLGTLQEQRWKSLGINFRYIFARLDKNIYEPFFTGMLGSLTYYSNPVITLGGTRTFLSGGDYDQDVTWQHAALVPFQEFFKESLWEKAGVEDPVDVFDLDDQTLALFISMIFPESRLKIFLEYGWNDHRWDWYDLRAHPDHSGASVIGFRKYGLFTFPEIVFGFEYANIMTSPYYPHRGTPDWYGRKVFDYSTYDGRRYAAHSGSDSDDMLLYIGYLDRMLSAIVSFNYERHGKIYSVRLLDYTGAFRYPEDKLEISLDVTYNIGARRFFIYYEYEFAENLGSPAQMVFPRVDNPERKANVIGIGFETNLYSFDILK